MSGPMGIILIDCWETIKTSTWPKSEFIFYRNLIRVMNRCQPRAMVFHTSDYGGIPLAFQLNKYHDMPTSVDIYELEQFSEFYKRIGVTNWLVVGAHWQICTHDRPLGFDNLLALKQQDSALRIYSRTDCLVKFTMDTSNNDNINNPIVEICNVADFENDRLHWECQGKLFELQLQ